MSLFSNTVSLDSISYIEEAILDQDGTGYIIGDRCT